MNHWNLQGSLFDDIKISIVAFIFFVGYVQCTVYIQTELSYRVAVLTKDNVFLAEGTLYNSQCLSLYDTNELLETCFKPYNFLYLFTLKYLSYKYTWLFLCQGIPNFLILTSLE